MLSFIDRWVKICSYQSLDIDFFDYMFAAFMLVLLSIIAAGMLAVAVFALYITLPWSAPVVGLTLVIFSIFWYAWRKQ